MNLIKSFLIISITSTLFANPADTTQSTLNLTSYDFSTALDKREKISLTGRALYCTGASLTYTSLALSILMFATDVYEDDLLVPMMSAGIGGLAFNHTGLIFSTAQARKIMKSYPENSAEYQELTQYRRNYFLGLLPMAGALTFATIAPPIGYSTNSRGNTIFFYGLTCLCLVIKDVLWSKTAFGTVQSIRKIKTEAKQKKSLNVTVSPAVYASNRYGMVMEIVF